MCGNYVLFLQDLYKSKIISKIGFKMAQWVQEDGVTCPKSHSSKMDIRPWVCLPSVFSYCLSVFLNYASNFLVNLEVLIQNSISLELFPCFPLNLLCICPFLLSLFVFLSNSLITPATRPLFIHSFIHSPIQDIPTACLLCFLLFFPPSDGGQTYTGHL